MGITYLTASHRTAGFASLAEARIEHVFKLSKFIRIISSDHQIINLRAE